MPEEANQILTSGVHSQAYAKPRILFVSPRALIRECIGALLNRLTPDFEIICARSVVDSSGEDVALVIAWDDEAGPGATTFIRTEAASCAQLLPRARFLAFVSADHKAALAADRIGDNIALLCVETATSEIAEAGIRLAIAGETFISARLVDSARCEPMIQHSARMLPHHGPATSPNGSEKAAAASHRAIMTRRELELLERVDRGQQNKVIAYELGISESTVKVHLRNLMRKLNATNRTQVAFIARQMNVKH